MPVLVVVEIGLQIICTIHAVKTGRPQYWFWIIPAFPIVGMVAYVVAEILPDLMGTKRVRGVASAAVKAIDPDRDYRQLVDNLDVADTVDNRRALAEEHGRRGNHAVAVKLYETALNGVHKDDPVLLHGKARAHFAAGEFAKCQQALDSLTAANPKYDSADAHLLYARALEGQARLDEARQEYETVAAYFPGAEAKCRHALLLRQLGESERARNIFADVVRGLDRAGKRFINDQREWYDLAKRHLGG